MGKTSLLITVVAIVLLSLVFIQPMLLGAQCMVATTNVFSSPSTITVTKILSGMFSCQTTMTNAHLCIPGSTLRNVASLTAIAMTATINPYCNWTCTCGPVTIDGSDGLPVELLDFEIEGEPGADGDS